MVGDDAPGEIELRDDLRRRTVIAWWVARRSGLRATVLDLFRYGAGNDGGASPGVLAQALFGVAPSWNRSVVCGPSA